MQLLKRKTSERVKLCCALQFCFNFHSKSTWNLVHISPILTLMLLAISLHFTFLAFLSLVIVSWLPRDTQVSCIVSPSDVGDDEFLPVKNEAQGTVLWPHQNPHQFSRKTPYLPPVKPAGIQALNNYMHAFFWCGMWVRLNGRNPWMLSRTLEKFWEP